MKKQFIKFKRFFSKSEINQIEENYLTNTLIILKQKKKKLYFKVLKKLNLKSLNKNKLIKIFETIEQLDKKFFYELNLILSNNNYISQFLYKKKLISQFKKKFSKIFFYQQTKPQIIFNKKDLNRLKYEWHQERTFYPNNLSLHLWFPIGRNVKKKNDGGLIFADNKNKILDYKKVLKKDDYEQRIPKINVEKKMKIIHEGADRCDAILFDANLLHKSANNNNCLPRIAIVVRYIGAKNKISLI